MRDYELTFIVRPDLPDDQIKAAFERVQGLVTQRGGELTHVQQWGRRRLAYEIDHHREGIYFVLRMKMDPLKEAEIEHELNLDEQVMRFLKLQLDARALEALKNPPQPMQPRERRPPMAPPPAPVQAPVTEAVTDATPVETSTEEAAAGESQPVQAAAGAEASTEPIASSEAPAEAGEPPEAAPTEEAPC